MNREEFLKKAIKDKGYNYKEFAAQIDIPYTTLMTMLNRSIGGAAIDNVSKVCRGLGISIGELQENDSSAKIYPTEQSIIQKYRTLDDHGKEAVDWTLDHEYSRCLAAAESTKEEPASYNVIPFRRSEQPCSAGRGVYLGPEAFETIMVIENDLTSRALFGVPVSGDSMEPLYHDGDTLIVEKDEDIVPGDIGVFTLDGEGYVKELGHGELISLNPVYDPIPVNESLIANGRVIGVLEPEWIIE